MTEVNAITVTMPVRLWNGIDGATRTQPQAERRLRRRRTGGVGYRSLKAGEIWIERSWPEAGTFADHAPLHQIPPWGIW